MATGKGGGEVVSKRIGLGRDKREGNVLKDRVGTSARLAPCGSEGFHSLERSIAGHKKSETASTGERERVGILQTTESENRPIHIPLT